VPQVFGQHICQSVHNITHLGIIATKSLISAHYVMLGMATDIGRWSKEMYIAFTIHLHPSQASLTCPCEFGGPSIQLKKCYTPLHYSEVQDRQRPFLFLQPPLLTLQPPLSAGVLLVRSAGTVDIRQGDPVYDNDVITPLQPTRYSAYPNNCLPSEGKSGGRTFPSLTEELPVCEAVSSRMGCPPILGSIGSS
jgi:hypothetical protein